MTRRGKLTADRAMARAQEATGLDDWGSDLSFREGLEIWLGAIEESGPSDALCARAAAEAHRLLTHRLMLGADARRQPEILQGDIPAPLVVTGLPRSGTTFLYDLLALAPEVRAPRQWEVDRPSPPPGPEDAAARDRVDAAQDEVDERVRSAPEMLQQHRWAVRLPTECNRIMMFHFAGVNFPAHYGVPGYVSWLCSQRTPEMFGTHRRILQQLQWGKVEKRWVLKCPGHLFELEGLVATYPDAVIVQIHRDPAEALVSMASVMSTRWRAGGVEGSKIEAGRVTARIWCTAVERLLESRRDPRVERAILDLAYADLVEDPKATVERVYEHLSLTASDQHKHAIDEHLEDHARSRRRPHAYEAADFGLAAGVLGSRLKGYRERFATKLGLDSESTN